jgi:hypothetical protein
MRLCCCHGMLVGKFAVFHGAASMRLSFVVMAKVVMMGCLVMMRRRHMVVFACGVRRMCMSL